MNNVYTWSEGLDSHNDHLGLETFNSVNDTAPAAVMDPNFKPVNLVIENGIYYITVYLCACAGGTIENQKLLIWLSSLKDTDYVKLSVSSLYQDLSLYPYIALLGAITRSKANIEIQLDTVVCDNLAYFYLAATTINRKAGGAILIPSYLDARHEDKSTPWVVVHSSIRELIARALANNILTEDEAARLNDGQSVIIPSDRF